MADQGFRGIIYIVRNNEVLRESVSGYADLPNQIPNTLETRFASASAGKVFVAVGILQLIEQGKLSLDDTLGKLLDFHNPNPAITRWQIEVLANELGISPDVVLTAFNCPKYEPHSNTEW